MNQNTKEVYLTKEGLKKLKKELQELKTVRSKEVIDKIRRARELGDLEDNLTFDAARDEQAALNARIAELEEMLKNVRVIKEIPEADFVVIGSTVVIETEGEIDEFTIVGSTEADPSKGRISNESPVGQALLGSRVGDIVEVTTSIVESVYKVLEVK